MLYKFNNLIINFNVFQDNLIVKVINGRFEFIFNF